MPSDKPTNPKDTVGSGKLPISLWPFVATIHGCLAMLHGALKYGRTNWRFSGVRASIYIDAAYRHLAAYDAGETYDPESGVHHLGHLLACAAILLDAEATGNLEDDRQYKLTPAMRELVEKLTPEVARLKAEFGDRDPKHFTIADL